uniref:Uncharacterized protein n=1 Tax=Molossus molossus TaxID=27622 RepID=A0A7J8GQM5_MOLMO|nr:hypothetical protein HJG59_011283 [Molossus molossus]
MGRCRQGETFFHRTLTLDTVFSPWHGHRCSCGYGAGRLQTSGRAGPRGSPPHPRGGLLRRDALRAALLHHGPSFPSRVTVSAPTLSSALFLPVGSGISSELLAATCLELLAESLGQFPAMAPQPLRQTCEPLIPWIKTPRAWDTTSCFSFLNCIWTDEGFRFVLFKYIFKNIFFIVKT